MEQIFKTQPDRCLALRGFDSFAAAAALHSATPSSFQVSGTFRDPADFAVLVLWDADNYFEHPSVKYLPDFDFTNLVLSFSLQYSDGAQPIDSPKYNWIDWATLDCVLVDDQVSARPKIRLWDYAMLGAGSFTPASGTFTITAGPSGPQAGDTITIWFENIAFSYTAPQVVSSVEYAFFAAGNGTVHTITVNGRVYSHTEANPAGESSADVAAALIALVNAGSGDPDVFASAGATSNAVHLAVLPTAPDAAIAVTASDGNAPAELGSNSPATIAAALAAAVNTNNPWQTSGGGLAVIASSSGPDLTIQAARYGFASTTGATVNWIAGHASAWSDKFPGLAPGDPIWLNGTVYAIAAVNSPTQLTLTATPPEDLTGAWFLAPRGGRDGNLFTLYSLASTPGQSTPNLAAVPPSLALSGGDSSCTWNISIDFTALAIDQLRQCWLTFAPSLANGAAYTPTDWIATFTNWTVAGGANQFLQIAGPGSVRVEENSSWCSYQGSGWSAPPGDVTGGFYSQYAAMVSKDAGDSVTIAYTCALVHNLYIGTSLYSDRGSFSVVLDGAAQPDLSCRINADSAVVSRRLLASSVPAGAHSVTLTSDGTGPVYFDFLEAAVLSNWPGPGAVFQLISPALDYDTDHSYKLSPARILWIFEQLGFNGPINEYIGVFWWNQRTAVGAVFQQAVVTFAGTWMPGDAVFLNINADPSADEPGFTMGKSVFAGDTSITIAAHFADYLNATSTSAWASAVGAVLTLTSRSPAPAYPLTVAAHPAPALMPGSTGTVTVVATQPTSTYPAWVIDPALQPVLNRAANDWHTDLYSLCAAAGLEITTAGSMELVIPPAGYAALFPDGTPVTTDTDVSTAVGLLKSTQCAVGGSLVLAYQNQFYAAIAALQSAAGLTPSLQFGEFLWWYFGNPQAQPDGMAYYDAETAAAAQTALGRPLYEFLTPNDDPTVNGSSDATFLRDRLRDHVATLVAALRAAYPVVKCEVLFPYDVNYPAPVQTGSELGGRLNYFVNLPVEWEQQASSGLDRIKVEALQFSTSFRSMDLVNQAVELMPGFGWPRSAVRYLAPVFGTFQPWTTEVGLAFSQNLNAVNLWAFDHICLYNLDLTNLREPKSSS